MPRHGIKIREQRLENYIERHGDRMTYERTKTRMNLMLASKMVLADIIGCLQFRCPRETGYGAQFGIRLKRVSKPNGKSSKLFYDIIIGTEYTAKGGQLKNAPYIAIQNIWEHDPGWIESALSDARAKIKSTGLWVQIYDPIVIAKYNRKNGGTKSKGGVAGYRVRVNMMYTQGVGI
jgi:hypothetical protein